MVLIGRERFFLSDLGRAAPSNIDDSQGILKERLPLGDLGRAAPSNIDDGPRNDLITTVDCTFKIYPLCSTQLFVLL